MRTAPPTILLVDDSAAIRAILRVYLSGLGVELIETDRAERGLQAMRLSKVSLVIADYNMPGMDGVEFVKAVRALPQQDLRSTPIILLTGATEAQLQGLALQAGTNLFLTKPVDSVRLRDAVARLLPGLSVARSA